MAWPVGLVLHEGGLGRRHAVLQEGGLLVPFQADAIFAFLLALKRESEAVVEGQSTIHALI